MRRRPPLSATALLALVLLVVSCGQKAPNQPVVAGDEGPAPTKSNTASSELQTTTSKAPAPTWPLTGMPLADVALANHPVVVVKIDNHPDARPHAGLNQADIVYELKVEGITRFAALFHSEDANPVGPIRSARQSDINLIANLNRPLMMWSGGNPGVTGEVKDAEAAGMLTDVSHSVGAAFYFRDNRRSAPHNLYANISDIRANFTPAGAGGPWPMFLYRQGNEPQLPTAVDAAGMSVDFGTGGVVQFVWDAHAGCWARFQNGAAFRDAEGRQVCPQNVVVEHIGYGVSEIDARSPKALTVGEGDAWVLSAGKVVVGRWKRESPQAMPILTDHTGALVKLTAGRTWIELPEIGSPVNQLDPASAVQLLSAR